MSAPRPTSPPSATSQTLSIRSLSAAQQHAPLTPSGLREAHTIAGSPEERRHVDSTGTDAAPSGSNPSPNTYPTHLDTNPGVHDVAIDGRADGTHGIGHAPLQAVTETTALLKKPFEFMTDSPHAGPCNHGTFSPRLESRAESVRSGRSDSGFGGAPRRRENVEEGESSMFASFLENIGVKNGSGAVKKRMSTTNWLAERHGITNTTSMYVSKLLSWLMCSWS